MSSEQAAIEANSLGKCYQIYGTPADRLRQAAYPRLQALAGLPVRSYFREFWALQEVSFRARRGETVGIIGRNGSGKSTLLQIIAGILSPSAGQVTARGRIAALLELGAGFNPEFTGRENVHMNAALLGLSAEETAARFGEIAAFADIGEFLDRPVKTYSSGMYVRLAFAVSACVDPDILIIDEALSVGDAAFQFKCLKHIETLQERGVTLLFVSHDINMVQRFCQRVIYLEQGRIKSAGDPQDVAGQYFFDTREQQRQSVAALPPYRQEAALGEMPQSMAFGNGLGRILSAGFVPDGAARQTLAAGEDAEFDVVLEYEGAEEETALAVSVDNIRLITLTGRFLPLPAGDGRTPRRFRVRIPNRFNAEHYFITIRLMRRVGWRQYLPLQSQIAALYFLVNAPPGDHPLPGYFLSDMALSERPAETAAVAAPGPARRRGEAGFPRVVALLTVRNEAAYLERCLRHLREQGVDAYIMDNESEDETPDIARRWLGKGVIGIETLPYPGYFDLHGQLARKTGLARELDADWFIHHDADEIRQSRVSGETLRGAIARLDAEGWNAIEFDEFVFVPTGAEGERPAADFVAEIRHAYYFMPRPGYRINAWKNTGEAINLIATAGHEVRFVGRRLAPERLILRHYPFLSRAHLMDKYTRQRIYNAHETEVLGWHGRRARFRAEDMRMPGADELLEPDREGWDTTRPWRRHPFLSGNPE